MMERYAVSERPDTSHVTDENVCPFHDLKAFVIVPALYVGV